MSIPIEQFNKIALKEDLKNFVTKEEFHQSNDKILSLLDKIISKLHNMELAFISNQVWHDRADRRIGKLEKKCF